MGVRLNVFALLAFSVSVLAGCGASKTSGEAKGPESNPWADYKGTYATAGSGSSSGSSKSGAGKSAKTEVAAAEAPKADEPAAVEEAPAPAPVSAAPAPPAKKGKTAGKGGAKKKK
jgi:hypothetical protein